MYSEKMKVSVIHHNTIIIEEMLGLRKEEGASEVSSIVVLGKHKGHQSHT